MSNSSETAKYVGEWSTCPVDDGGATDFQLILLPSGDGVMAEWNWYSCYVEDIIWDITDDVLTVKNTDEFGGHIIIKGTVVFEENAEVEDIIRKKHSFDCFQVAGGCPFYRVDSHNSHGKIDSEIEHSLKSRIADLKKELAK